MSVRRRILTACGGGATAFVLSWAMTTGQAAAQPRLSAPSELAAGLRIPFTISGVPANTRVVIERRTVGDWHPVRALVSDSRGRARASVRTRPRPSRRLRFRAALADGTTATSPIEVRLRYVTLRAVGDINLGDGPGAVMARRGPRWPWLDVAPMLHAADIAFGNLECSVSHRGAPVPKQYNVPRRSRATCGPSRDSPAWMW